MFQNPAEPIGKQIRILLYPFLSVENWNPQCVKRARSKWGSEKRRRRRSTENENVEAMEEDTARRRNLQHRHSVGGSKKPWAGPLKRCLTAKRETGESQPGPDRQ